MTRILPIFMGLLSMGCTPKTSPNTASPPTLPTVASVLEKAIVATGGQKILETIENASITFSVTIPQQGIEGTLIVHHKAPNQMVAYQEFPGLASVNQGYNGTIGWATDNLMGPRLLEGVELETTRRDADLYWLVDFADYYPTAEVTGRMEIGGEPAWQIHAHSTWDREDDFFFHTETGLQIAVETVTETPMGSMPMQVRFENFEQRHGLTLATRQILTTGPVVMITELMDFQINIDSLPPIEVPDDVKALLAPEQTP